MRELLKSKLGIFFASIYLLLIFLAIFEGQNSRPHSMDGVAMLILTAPCSFLLAILFDGLGIRTSENSGSLLYVYVAFGGLINTTFLYLIGYLLTKTIRYLSTIQPKS